MTKHCPYCGTPLRETTYNRNWCANCGIIEEQEPSTKDSYDGYIG